MKFRIKYILPIAVLAVAPVLFSSCYRMELEVEKVPGNTPPNARIFVTGNFNNWDPGDERYELKMGEDSIYRVTMPAGFGEIEYKYTRGDRATVEEDICGYAIPSRTVAYGEREVIRDSVMSWGDLDPLDCNTVTLVIENLPENTPPGSLLALASSLNNWDPENTDLVFEIDSFTQMAVLEVPRLDNVREIDYKVTRGSLDRVESDEFGQEIPGRKLSFGQKDTVYISVKGWEDLAADNENQFTIILKDIPENTPADDPIYIAGNFTGWYPRKQGMMLEKTRDGRYFINLPKQNRIIQYKFTRGDWGTVEVDRYGYDITNREIDPGEADTVFVEVEQWKDLSYKIEDEILIRISGLPENTPPDDAIYIAGNFNDWDPGRRKWIMEKDDEGSYYIFVPREGGLLEFKFTRGGWGTVEADAFGEDISNRTYRFAEIEEIEVQVTSWKDLPLPGEGFQTIVLKSVPRNTPAGDKLYLAPDFNGWDPGDNALVFKKKNDGTRYLTFQRRKRGVEYKITRGDWETVECDRDGDDISNRYIPYTAPDTVYIEVLGWTDR